VSTKALDDKRRRLQAFQSLRDCGTRYASDGGSLSDAQSLLEPTFSHSQLLVCVRAKRTCYEKFDGYLQCMLVWSCPSNHRIMAKNSKLARGRNSSPRTLKGAHYVRAIFYIVRLIYSQAHCNLSRQERRKPLLQSPLPLFLQPGLSYAPIRLKHAPHLALVPLIYSCQRISRSASLGPHRAPEEAAGSEHQEVLQHEKRMGTIKQSGIFVPFVLDWVRESSRAGERRALNRPAEATEAIPLYLALICSKRA
jgi:hypothetical protein